MTHVPWRLTRFGLTMAAAGAFPHVLRPVAHPACASGAAALRATWSQIDFAVSLSQFLRGRQPSSSTGQMWYSWHISRANCHFCQRSRIPSLPIDKIAAKCFPESGHDTPRARARLPLSAGQTWYSWHISRANCHFCQHSRIPSLPIDKITAKCFPESGHDTPQARARPREDGGD